MGTPAKQAVLFDLDGTLLDTIDDLADSLNAVLAAEGLPTSPTAEHKFMVGDGVRNYVLRSLPPDRRDDEDLLARVTGKYRDAYTRNWAVKTRVYVGVAEMLAALTERGVRLAVLSNKPDDFTRAMVSHFLGAFPFEVVRGALPEVPMKPDPAAAVAIAEQMHLTGEAFGYLGDTATDMQTARAAGMFAVGALWGFRPRTELADAGAEALIAHPAELPELL